MSIKIVTDSEDCSKNIIDSRNKTRISNLEEDKMIWEQICSSTFKTIESKNECYEGSNIRFVILKVNAKGEFEAKCPEYIGSYKNGKPHIKNNEDLQEVIQTIGKRLWRMNSIYLGLNSPLDITIEMIQNTANKYLQLDEDLQCFFCREPTRQSIDELVQIRYLEEYCECDEVEQLNKEIILLDGKLNKKSDPSLKKENIKARSLDARVVKQNQIFYGFCKYSGPTGSVTSSLQKNEVTDFLTEAKNYLDRKQDLHFFAQIDGVAGENEIPLLKKLISDYEERIFVGNSKQVAAWITGK